MEIPSLHRQRDQKSAEEEIDDRMRIRRGRRLDLDDAEKRKEHHRQERRYRDGDRLGDPPDRHETSDAGHTPTTFVQAFGGGKNESEEKKRGPQKPTRDLTTAEADAVPFHAIHVLPSTLQGCGGTRLVLRVVPEGGEDTHV